MKKNASLHRTHSTYEKNGESFWNKKSLDFFFFFCLSFKKNSGKNMKIKQRMACDVAFRSRFLFLLLQGKRTPHFLMLKSICLFFLFSFILENKF